MGWTRSRRRCPTVECGLPRILEDHSLSRVEGCLKGMRAGTFGSRCGGIPMGVRRVRRQVISSPIPVLAAIPQPAHWLHRGVRDR